MTSTKQMVITLFVVALSCSVILSLVYSYTAPRIEETQKQLTLDGLREVISAQEYVEVLPDTLWRAIDSAGDVMGIVFRVFPQGYGGSIPITVGLGLDGKITGVRIASAAEGLKETPGLGVKITEPDFRKQFIGKCATEVQLKKDGGEIDAITAATISSRAVCDGIKKGIDAYSSYLAPSIDKKCVYPDGQEFLAIIKDTLWYALKDSDTVGLVFIGTTKGYADIIKYIVGVNKEQKITGVDILYVNETENINNMIMDKKFLDTFKKRIPDAISGATTVSRSELVKRSLIASIKKNLSRFTEYLK